MVQIGQEIMFLIILGLLNIITIYFCFSLKSHINEFVSKNKKISKSHVNSIVIGIVSGAVVLIVDRGIKIIWDIIKIYISEPSISMLLLTFLAITFLFELIYLLIFYIVHEGIR